MATVRKEIVTRARPDQVWDAIRDIGALHTRLVPGFVTATRLEPGARIVTFANGVTVREPIVTLDDAAMRLVWAVEGLPTTHYNASAEVVPGTRCHPRRLDRRLPARRDGRPDRSRNARPAPRRCAAALARLDPGAP